MPKANEPNNLDELFRHVRSAQFALGIVCVTAVIAVSGSSKNPAFIQVELVKRIAEDWRPLILEWSNESLKEIRRHPKFPAQPPPSQYSTNLEDWPKSTTRGQSVGPQILYPVIVVVSHDRDLAYSEPDGGFRSARGPDLLGLSLQEFVELWNAAARPPRLIIASELVNQLYVVNGAQDAVAVPLRTYNDKLSSARVYDLYPDADWGRECEHFDDFSRQQYVQGAAVKPFCRATDDGDLGLGVPYTVLSSGEAFAKWVLYRLKQPPPDPDDDGYGGYGFDHVFPDLATWAKNRQQNPLRDVYSSLRQELNDRDESFHVLGVAVNKTALMIFAPIFIFVLQLYIQVFLSQAVQSNDAAPIKEVTLPWTGLYSGMVPVAFTHFVGWIFPAMTLFIVLANTWDQQTGLQLAFGIWFFAFSLVFGVCHTHPSLTKIVRLRSEGETAETVQAN